MIKIKIALAKDNGDIVIADDILTGDNKIALLEVAEVLARNFNGSDINSKVAYFKRVLKRAAKTAEDCDTENLKDLIGQDYAEVATFNIDGSRSFDKCYDDTW